ncbi:CHASE domain-containing protein [Spartinivicinus ruber]|uniref:CHASE domain-containing protein n=1 Tax=Spartinivicinus ruber TaxID=2683272 RepID=UPI0013D88F9E|nr:PAS domain S-box protein [Spartinivicinus ruber]
MKTLASLYAINSHISRNQFDYFVKRSIEEFNNIQALEWVPRVPAHERLAYEKSAQADGLTNFKFKKWQPDGSWMATDESWSEEYFPVYYLQPFNSNKIIMGVDLASSPYRSKILNEARDSGKLQSTARMILDDGNKKQVGYLTLVPVFKNNEINVNVDTVQQRRTQLRGFVVGVFRISDIVKSTLEKLAFNHILLDIVDVTVKHNDKVMYEMSNTTSEFSDYSRTLSYSIGGREWEFRFFATHNYVEAISGWQSWLILVVGGVLTIVIGAVLYALTGQVKATEEIVQQRTMELSRTNERLNRVFEAVPSGLVMVSEAGKILFINSMMESLFGYQQDEIAGQPVEILLPEPLRKDHPQLRDSYFRLPVARAMGGGRDLMAVCKNGGQFPVEINLSPVETSEGMFVLASVVDITWRKKLEDSQKRLNVELIASNKAFEQSIDRLNKVFEAVPSGLIMVDKTGRVVMVNSAMEKLFGYGRNELINQPLEILLPEPLRAAHPKLRDSFFRQPATRLMGQGRDLAAVRKNGSQFSVEIGLNPVKTPEGVFVIASVVDITARRKYTEDQKRLNQKLVSSNEALAQSNIELQQFAYVASHDLQAPLRGISGFAQFLQKRYHGKLDETADNYIDRIVDGTHRMQTLINDLLAYSRVESRSCPFQVVSLNDVFDDAIALLSASIEDANASVTRDELP